MSTTPRVSVITPAHNAEQFISETIASVTQQTLGDWELIVVDDASDDGTATVVAAAARADSRISLIARDRNGGPARARNDALRRAVGNYVVFLDADDTLDSNYLSVMTQLAQRSEGVVPRLGAVACNARLEGDDGDLDYDYFDLCGNPDRVSLRGILDGNCVFVGALVPRRVVTDVGGFSPSAWGSEDHDLWIKIRERGYEIVANPHHLATYRVRREGSLTSHKARMALAAQEPYVLALRRGHLPARERRFALRRLAFYEALHALHTQGGDVSLSGWVRWARIMDGAARNPDLVLRHARRKVAGSPSSPLW